ncbi:YafY family transcriptional regulator [Ktedonosporobacter rubrisoli]|uniref:YafY family transcriptional regulator n=1 Tax=Ktedonosporobacter rubrisoli TaxID=2509675 RepID=A0A4P6JMP8_KTERU|nr:YafY family protein [Ktedonosporobacter rubrisoli]QBD76514.1 YafY family transcriptional regulator [Ktedonosporobacter rubrisoli]
MYHPTSRVLTVLELLQSRPSITGPELAARLEMDVRTVRRYITHLQDVGIPVEANIGRHGGYRLRPGFKLPPLLFTEEEATAIILGLLGTSWLEIGQPAAAVEGALAKVMRVLPFRARERLNAISSHMFFFSPQNETRPDISLLLSLSEAIGQQQRIALDYRSHYDQVTHRKVEPYAIIGWEGHWYLVGYCCLRQDHRTFRLDRIQHVKLLEEPFEKDETFDCQAYVMEKHARAPEGDYIEVEFQVPLYTVQQKIPAYYGKFSATPNGILYQGHAYNLDQTARYLISLNLPFVIHQPQGLRDALIRLAEEMRQTALTQPAPEENVKQEAVETHKAQ